MSMKLSSSALQRMWTSAPRSDRDAGFGDTGLSISGTAVGSIKVVGEEERRLETQEYHDIVRKILAHRLEHAASAAKRAWGAKTPSSDAWGRSLGSPSKRPSSARPSSARPSRAGRSLTASGPPAGGDLPVSALVSQLETSAGKPPGGVAVEAQVSQLETHVGKLRQDVATLRGESGDWRPQSARVGTSGPIVATRDPALSFSRPAVVVPPAYSSKVTQLALEHARNLAILERVLREKDASAARVSELESQLPASAPAPATVPAGGDAPLTTASQFDAGFDDGEGDQFLPPGEGEGGAAEGGKEDEEDDAAWAARIRKAYLGQGDVPEGKEKELPEPAATTATTADLLRAATAVTTGRGALTRPALTSTQPFGVEQRSQSVPRGISKLRQEADRAEREAEEAQWGKPVVTPKEVPEFVKEKLYEKMLQEQKETREMNHAARVSVLMSSVNTFNGMAAREEEMRQRREAKLAKQKEREEEEARKRQEEEAAKKAKVSQSLVQSADLTAVFEKKEAERLERIRRRALEMFAGAALPKRMQEHEAEGKTAGPKVSLSSSAQFTHKPAIKPFVPDFEKAHGKWAETLAAAKARGHAEATAPAPFADTEEVRQKREEARAARRQKSQERAAASAAARTPVVPSPAKTQEALRRRMEVEKRLEEEEKERQKKQRQLTKEYAPVIAGMEAVRREKMGPLIWHLDTDSPEVIAKRQQDAKEAARLRAKCQAGIEAAVARRPLLIERSGVAAAGREGRRSATLAMVERLAGEGVTPAVAGITLGDDDYDDV